MTDEWMRISNRMVCDSYIFGGNIFDHNLLIIVLVTVLTLWQCGIVTVPIQMIYFLLKIFFSSFFMCKKIVKRVSLVLYSFRFIFYYIIAVKWHHCGVQLYIFFNL